MVLMQGSKRVFETPVVEDSSSTALARAVSIYGVSSYDNILNSIIHIRSLVGGIEGVTTININELGAKNIKIYKLGSKQNLPGNWTSIGQIYTIYYDGTDFILSGNYDNASSASSEVTYEMNLSNFVTLSESSTAEDITNAFGGEDEIAAFKSALNYGTITGYTNSEMNNTKHTCVLQNSGISSDSPYDTVCFVLVNDGSGSSMSAVVGAITFAFRRGENNEYTAVKVLSNRLADITDIGYSIPSALLDLSTVSEETILEAFGGEQQVELFKQAMLGGTHMTVGNTYTVLFTTTSYSKDTFVFYNPSSTSTTKVELLKSESTGKYGNITITVTPLATSNSVNESINTKVASIIEPLPEQISAWALGDGTSYPPATPNETTLTEYMTSNIISKLENYVNNGIIIRAAGILSGADRKSIYTNLYVVNKNYSATESNDYEYYFKNIVGSTDFYIYWDNSELKWYWNQKGAITGEVCFAGETKVLTPDGLTSIEDLKVGDEVISYNFENSKREVKSITKVESHKVSSLYTISTLAGDIRVTGDHPFYVVGVGEVLAMNLSAADRLMNYLGEEIEIKLVSVELTDEVSVYEIAIKDNYNYFVGEDSVLVFNEPCMKD